MSWATSSSDGPFSAVAPGKILLDVGMVTELVLLPEYASPYLERLLVIPSLP
jgi:hypothetical protein